MQIELKIKGEMEVQVMPKGTRKINYLGGFWWGSVDDCNLEAGPMKELQCLGEIRGERLALKGPFKKIS